MSVGDSRASVPRKSLRRNEFSLRKTFPTPRKSCPSPSVSVGMRFSNEARGLWAWPRPCCRPMNRADHSPSFINGQLRSGKFWLRKCRVFRLVSVGFFWCIDVFVWKNCRVWQILLIWIVKKYLIFYCIFLKIFFYARDRCFRKYLLYRIYW